MARQHDTNLKTFFQGTHSLDIHLTSYCNLRCRHCYTNACAENREMLPFELAVRTIREAKFIGIKKVHFSGGEPLLYSHINQILAETADGGLQVEVFTNGTVLTSEIISQLGAIGATVFVSLDGPKPFHDPFRGKEGCFDDTVSNVARLIEKNVNVNLVTTVTKENFQWIDWCINWAGDHGIKMLQFQPLELSGRGGDLAAQRLTEEDVLDMYFHFFGAPTTYSPNGVHISMTYQKRDRLIAHPCLAFVCNDENCHRGVEKELKHIIIRENGLILPELVTLHPRFAIGNVHNETLSNSIRSYLNNGYATFNRLCRNVYHEFVPSYPSPLIPWNELLSQQSYHRQAI